MAFAMGKRAAAEAELKFSARACAKATRAARETTKAFRFRVQFPAAAAAAAAGPPRRRLGAAPPTAVCRRLRASSPTLATPTNTQAASQGARFAAAGFGWNKRAQKRVLSAAKAGLLRAARRGAHAAAATPTCPNEPERALRPLEQLPAAGVVQRSNAALAGLQAEGAAVAAATVAAAAATGQDAQLRFCRRVQVKPAPAARLSPVHAASAPANGAALACRGPTPGALWQPP